VPELSISANATPWDSVNTYVTFSGDARTLWTWNENGNLNQMTLDRTGLLTLWGSDGISNSSTNLTLDPGNETLAFAGNLGLQQIDGAFVMSANILDDGAGNIAFDPGNQTIVFSSGVTFNATTANVTIFAGDSGFVVGNGATATGYRSAAFGGTANATGNSSVALSGGAASGYLSLAAAYGLASGAEAVALSSGTASGNYSLSAGNNSLANATGAVALGTNTTASVLNSVTVGHYNTPISGNATTWVATDPAFIVGTGSAGNSTSNGLVVLNNGNTSISGDAAVAGNTTVTGNLTVNGTVNFSGNVTYPSAFGDVSMGVYGTYGE
jgi:hypothetical protein